MILFIINSLTFGQPVVRLFYPLMGKGMCTFIRIEMFVLKLKSVVVSKEQNTKHAAHETQIDRQVEKKAYTHYTHSQKQENI